jgi:hypothetical protein
MYLWLSWDMMIEEAVYRLELKEGGNAGHL